MPDNYTPRFRSSIYLEFLNKYLISFHLDDIFEIEYIYNGQAGSRDGYSIEECIDKAIASTNFEKEIK
jgi:hypothetical protein